MNPVRWVGVALAAVVLLVAPQATAQSLSGGNIDRDVYVDVLGRTSAAPAVTARGH